MPFNYKLFITAYIGIPVYVFGYLGYKCEYPSLAPGAILIIVIRGTSYVRIDQMDLSSGSREFHDIEDETEEEHVWKELNWKQKVVYYFKNW